MRVRWGLAALALSTVFAFVGHAAAGGEEAARVVTRTYVTNGFLVGGHGNLAGQPHHLTLPEDSVPIVLRPGKGERFVELAFEDGVGPWPAVLVRQPSDGGHHDEEIEFCAPARYFEIDSGRPIEIRVFSGVCHAHTYGVATTGTLTATFYRE